MADEKINNINSTENGNEQNQSPEFNLPAESPKKSESAPSAEKDLLKPAKKKRKLFRKFFLVLFILIIAFLILIQTSLFKNWALHYAVDKINESLAEKESVLNVGSVEGSIIKGLRLNGISLVVKNDTLANIGFVELKYDLLQLLKKRIKVRSAIVSDPAINFTKVRDKNNNLVWNLAYLLESEEEIDTAKKEFDWKITADNVEIINGNLRILAEKKQDIPIGMIDMPLISQLDMDNLDVRELNIRLSGNYFPDEKNVKVQKISFKTNSDFNLNNLSFEAEIKKNDHAELRELNFLTDKSKVDIKLASLDHMNPFKHEIDYEDFRDKKFEIDMIADKFNFEDIEFFLPDIDFLGGSVYANIKTSGNYKDFTLDRLQISLNHGTFISLKGRVKDLHDPSNMYLDVSGDNIVINPLDKEYILHGLEIPKYTHIGTVNADFKFKGEPTKRFDAEIDFKSSAGNVQGKAYIDYSGQNLIYKTDLRTQNVNIGKILEDKSLESSITGEFIIDGNGTDYRTLNSRITYKLDNSSIYGQKISSSAGNITARSGLYEIDINYNSNTGSVKTAGNVDIRNLDNITYNLKGACSDINLETVTKNPDTKSSLNFAFNVSGSGTSPDDILGKFEFQINKSYYNNFLIPPTPLIASFEKDGENKNIIVNSDLFDLEAKGKYSLMTLPDIINRNIADITQEVTDRLKMDSASLSYGSFDVALDKKQLRSNIKSYEGTSTNLSYDIKIKNLLPLYISMGDSSILMKCEIKGRLRDAGNDFLFTVKGDISDFKYGDTVLMFSKGKINAGIFHTGRGEGTGVYRFDVKANLDKLHAGNKTFDTVRVLFSTDPSKPDLELYAYIDTSMSAYAKGMLGISDNNYGIRFDSLGIKYFDYNLVNNGEFLVSYELSDSTPAERIIRINNMKMTDEGQKVNINGYYSFDGNSDISVSADRISIAKLQKLNSRYVDKNTLIKGNVRRFKLDFKGSLSEPVVHSEINSDFLSLYKLPLGRVDALIDYKDNKLVPQIGFYNVNNEGYLGINGYVPFANLLNAPDSVQFAEEILKSDVNLIIESRDFQIGILQQFLPVVSSLKGKMNGEIDITGKVNAPILSGGLTVNKGGFILDMTGVRYNFDADLSTSEQKLNFDKFRVYHPGEESKIMNMGGYIDFTNLGINELALTFEGEGKLLDEAVTQNIMGIYGNLYGKTGQSPLILVGNMDSLWMGGDLDITEGRIYIVPQKKVAYDIFSDNFRYDVIFDSLSFGKDSFKVYVNRLSDSISVFDKTRLDPFDLKFYKSEDSLKVAKKSNFKYQINIRTLKDIYARMLIDEKTRQEFTGNVSANITFDNLNSPSFNTRGRVEVHDNSYYKFYKNFEAEGYVIFTDTIFNPELNIKGVYETTSADPNNSSNTRQVTINLYVTGKAMNPTLNWEVYKNGNPVGGSDPTDEAISYIIFGRFKDELNANERLNLFSSVGVNVGTNLMSQYLSNVLSEYIPFLLKTDISYKDSPNGSFAENTDIRFTAEIAGATIIFGGQILRDLSNTNFLIEYPLNKLIGMKSFSQNLLLMFERYVDPFSQNSSLTTTKRTGGAILYRIKF